MMGVVYEAHDPGLGRTVALKTIHLAFALSRSERELFEQRFLSEARIAARLSHPGIIAVHDVGRDPETGTLYMSLEYLEGITLADVIRAGGALPWQEALGITRRVADALHHAHSQGVVHRDVKPANIMLLPSGLPKIMDFGIAKTETARIELTAAGQFFGTPLYMAPEQALGRKVDARADLFSLGAIAYALLTGRQAFGAESITKVIGRVVHDDPRAPSEVAPGLPEEVDYLIARALAKDPDGRYPDGRTLAEDVQDILEGRVPRHREGWMPPPRLGLRAGPPATPSAAGGTETLDLELVLADRKTTARRAVVDIEAELATLVSAGEGAGQPKQVRLRDGPLPIPRSADLRAGAQPNERWGVRWGVAMVAASGLAALAILYFAERPQPAVSGVAPSQRSVPTVSLSPSATGRPTLPARAPASAGAAARLTIDLEHTLRTGTLRVWLDGTLVVKEDLEGRVTKNIAWIKIRNGRVEETLHVNPGKHVVRVRVAWADNSKDESVSGTFDAGMTRRLEIRLGRLRKNLSVQWSQQS
jgi:serine/threonine-protein kinase